MSVLRWGGLKLAVSAARSNTNALFRTPKIVKNAESAKMMCFQGKFGPPNKTTCTSVEKLYRATGSTKNTMRAEHGSPNYAHSQYYDSVAVLVNPPTPAMTECNGKVVSNGDFGVEVVNMTGEMNCNKPIELTLKRCLSNISVASNSNTVAVKVWPRMIYAA